MFQSVVQRTGVKHTSGTVARLSALSSSSTSSSSFSTQSTCCAANCNCACSCHTNSNSNKKQTTSLFEDIFTTTSSTSTSSQSKLFNTNGSISTRTFMTSMFAMDDAEPLPSASVDADPKIVDLADQICQLNMLEMASLTDVLQDKLGLQDVPMGGFVGGAVGGGAPAAGGAGEEAAAPAEDKLDWDIKLESFDASAKLKVIREVRAAVKDLTLVEAKKMVEGAADTPVVLREKVPKAEAEELKKKLEEVGAKISLI
eukprot:TRINITY_DN9385_c2_g2_i1.p1 TRINITY_DN9385_c2_g2~~TRINITY_DN9385_c2_g2_i1.p1  ORF type:complete len:257 (+),score=79.47 TRINITY_DN9385_c2_g2_i1:928-1698(+)